MTEQPNTPMNEDKKDVNNAITPVSDSNDKLASKKLLDNKLANKKSSHKTLNGKKAATNLKAKKDSSDDAPTVPHPLFIEVSQRCLVPANKLKRYSKPTLLPADTRSAPDLDIGFGQQRALKALHTALDIHASGYHVFAAGENGLGKWTIISRLLHLIAADAPTPDDWAYVHNFADPRTPLALRLPAGQATILQQQVNNLWQQAKKRLSQRFRSDQYQSKIEAIKNDTHQKESHAYDALNAEGKQYDLTLTFRPFDNKAVFVHPSQLETESSETTDKDKTISDQDMKAGIVATDASDIKAYDIETSDIEASKSAYSNDHETELSNFAQKNHMQKRLSQLTIALEQLEDEANDAIELLHRNIAERALKPLFTPVYEQFSAQPLVVDYLKTVFSDMVAHVEHIVNGDDEEFVTALLATTPSRYAVNVVISHEPDSGTPVIFEDLPTHLNLLGHVE